MDSVDTSRFQDCWKLRVLALHYNYVWEGGRLGDVSISVLMQIKRPCITNFLGQSSAHFSNSHSKYIDSGQQSINYDVEAPSSIRCGNIVSSFAGNRLVASCSCGTRNSRFRARLRGFGVPVAGTMPPGWWPQSSSLRELMGCRNKLCVLIRHTRHSSWILLMIIDLARLHREFLWLMWISTVATVDELCTTNQVDPKQICIVKCYSEIWSRFGLGTSFSCTMSSWRIFCSDTARGSRY